MKNTTRFMIVTRDSYRIIDRNFSSFEAALRHMKYIDYGQFENEGGWIIREYTIE